MKILLDPNTGMTLNPVRTDDQPVLYSLMDTIYREAYQYVWKDQGEWYVNLIYNAQTVEKELSRPYSHYFFVESEGKKIGILKYDFPFSPREVEIPNAMKLHRLYLSSDFHGKGAGKVLVEHCEQLARENELENIWLEVMSCQPQAKKFYRKMGFEHVLSYQLDFEMILPEYRGIEIWKKGVQSL